MSPPASERAEPIAPHVRVTHTLRSSYGARTTQRVVPTTTVKTSWGLPGVGRLIHAIGAQIGFYHFAIFGRHKYFAYVRVMVRVLQLRCPETHLPNHGFIAVAGPFERQPARFEREIFQC